MNTLTRISQVVTEENIEIGFPQELTNDRHNIHNKTAERTINFITKSFSRVSLKDVLSSQQRYENAQSCR